MGGGDKCLLNLAGKPILAHVIHRLDAQISPIVINANGDPVRFSGFGLRVIADNSAAGTGPLAGILAGMTFAAANGFSHVLTVAADTPFLPQTLFVRLATALERTRKPVAIAATTSTSVGTAHHPTCALWSATRADDLAEAIAAGQRKITSWAAKAGFAEVVFETSPIDPFFNINTPQDLLQAEQILHGGAA